MAEVAVSLLQWMSTLVWTHMQKSTAPFPWLGTSTSCKNLGVALEAHSSESSNVQVEGPLSLSAISKKWRCLSQPFEDANSTSLDTSMRLEGKPSWLDALLSLTCSGNQKVPKPRSWPEVASTFQKYSGNWARTGHYITCNSWSKG